MFENAIFAHLKHLQVDVSSAVAYVTATKDESEIQIMRKASQVTVDVFNKYLKDQIMEIIDSDKVHMVHNLY
jgi:Xaa-Pro aminopeptidase